MKSVGETMAIGRNFKQALQKALRSLEIGRAGLVGRAEAEGRLADAELESAVARPSPLRLFHLREALARGWSVARLAELSGIDPWFLRQMGEIVAFEDEIRTAQTLAGLAADRALFAQAKNSDFQTNSWPRCWGRRNTMSGRRATASVCGRRTARWTPARLSSRPPRRIFIRSMATSRKRLCHRLRRRKS